MLVCVFYIAFCTRDRGCSAHPAFPAPSTSRRVKDDANLGRIAPRECDIVSGVRCLTIEEEFVRSAPVGTSAATPAPPGTGSSPTARLQARTRSADYSCG